MPVYAQPMATFPVRNAATIKLIPTRLERPIGGPAGLAGKSGRCGLSGRRSIGGGAWASLCRWPTGGRRPRSRDLRNIRNFGTGLF